MKGQIMKANKNFVIIISSILCFCAPTIKEYSLLSISDPKSTAESKKPSAYINLKRDSNTVAVFNWDTYDNFNVYRANSPNDSFLLIGKLSAGAKGSITRLVTSFYDKRGNDVNNRYIIKPIANGSELDRLPSIYETTDSSYYRSVEKTK